MNEFITIKIWKKTLKKLRLVAAAEGKSMALVIHEIIAKKYREVWK